MSSVILLLMKDETSSFCFFFPRCLISIVLLQIIVANAIGWVKSANRLANKPYRQSAGYLQNANRFLGREKRQFLDFQ